LADLSDRDFNALDPVQWPAAKGQAETKRCFADGGFFTPDRKARMVAPESPRPRHAVNAEFPLRLNTGRVRDQWHTMTRSGLSPRLATHKAEPFVEVHPDDAATHGLKHDGFARLRSAYGACVLKVIVTDTQQPGSLFVPIHWSAETAAAARVGALVTPATDPFSGQPEAKATPVAIEAVDYQFRGFALTRTPMILPDATWWARASVTHGVGYLLATNDAPSLWQARAQEMFAGAEIAEYSDRGAGFIASPPLSTAVSTAVCSSVRPRRRRHGMPLKALFESETLGETQRRAVLSGKSADGLADPGPVICACFGVGLNVIRTAIASGARPMSKR